MKNILKSVGLLTLCLGAFTACDDDLSENPTVAQPTSFTLNAPTVQNGKVDLEKSTGIDLAWSQPVYTDLNSPMEVIYTVQVSSKGTFNTAYDANADDNSAADYITLDNTYQTTTATLNAAELDLALMRLNLWEQDAVPATQDVSIRMKAALADATNNELYPILSNVVKFTAIPYYQAMTNADPELWYLIGGDIADGAWGNNVPSSSLPMQPVDGFEYDAKTGQGTITWTGYLAGNGFKLKKTTDSWDDQWGADGNGGYVHNDGGSSNITVSEPGVYTVTLNTADSKFESSAVTVTKYDGEVTDFPAMYITGSFNDWGTANPMTAVHTYDGAQNHDWYTTVELSEGDEVKFYDGTDSWTHNSGGLLNTLTDGAYGYGAQNGDNIKIATGGKYLVIYNDITRYYRFILQQ